MPLGDWPVALRNFTPAWSAWSSWVRTYASSERWIADCGAMIAAAPTLPLPERALATIAPTLQMAAGKVAGLMREHADDLVRRLGVEQRAGIDEDVAAVHDESVEGAVAEHHHLDALLGEAGRAQDRRCVVAQQLLDLGVADDRHAARQILRAGRRNRRTAAGRRHRNGGGKRERAPCWRHAPCPDRCPVLDHADLLPNGREPSDARHGGQRGLRSRLSHEKRRGIRQQRGGGSAQ